MSKGSILIYTSAAGQAAPLAGAALTVLDESGTALAHLTADADGRAEAADLPAPDAAYSLDAANTAVRPYALYRIEAALDGWQPLVLDGVQVLTDSRRSHGLHSYRAVRSLPLHAAAKRRSLRYRPTRCFPGTAAAALRRRRFCPAMY